MFGISEHTALQSGRNHQQVNQKAAKIAATATLALIKLTASILQKLIKSIINRLQGKKDSSIEIKINNQLVFKGKVGEKPTVNKLSLNDLTAILESAMADSQQNIQLVVKADNKVVYASNRGQVKINQLDASLQADKSSEHQVASSREQSEDQVNQPSNLNAPKTAVPTNKHQGAENNAKQSPDYELESNSLIAVLSAKRVLDKLSTNEYENQNYRFQRSGNTITVSAKDGRGEIAQLSAGRITSKNLSHNDVTSLTQIAERLKYQPESSVHQVHSQANSATPNPKNVSHVTERPSISIDSLLGWHSKAVQLGKKPEYLNRITAVTNDFKLGKPLPETALNAMQRDEAAQKQLHLVVKNAHKLLQAQGHSVDETLYHSGEKYSLELQETVDSLTVTSPERGVILSYEQGRARINKLDDQDFQAFDEIGQELERSAAAKQEQNHAYTVSPESEEIER